MSDASTSTAPVEGLDRRRIAVVVAIGFACGFVLYGAFRTMFDQVGFDVGRSTSIFLGLAMFLCPLLGAALLTGAAFHWLRVRSATVKTVCASAAVVVIVTAVATDFAFLVGPVAAGLILAGTMHGRTRRPHLRAGGLLALAIVVGAALSEGWVLLDEARFRDEIATSGADHQIGRARWWPNGNAGLQYAPDRGVWGTD